MFRIEELYSGDSYPSYLYLRSRISGSGCCGSLTRMITEGHLSPGAHTFVWYKLSSAFYPHYIYNIYGSAASSSWRCQVKLELLSIGAERALVYYVLTVIVAIFCERECRSYS